MKPIYYLCVKNDYFEDLLETSLLFCFSNIGCYDYIVRARITTPSMSIILKIHFQEKYDFLTKLPVSYNLQNGKHPCRVRQQSSSECRFTTYILKKWLHFRVLCCYCCNNKDRWPRCSVISLVALLRFAVLSLHSTIASFIRLLKF
jgi:hypothetical protein